MKTTEYGIEPAYQLPDELWQEIEPLLPLRPPAKNGRTGRPPMHDRQAMTAIFYLLGTGCQWKALPRSLGAASSVKVEAVLLEWGFGPHIQARGQEATAKRELPGYRARRGVVERRHSWLNRFRRLLIRWEKKVAN